MNTAPISAVAHKPSRRIRHAIAVNLDPSTIAAAKALSAATGAPVSQIVDRGLQQYLRSVPADAATRAAIDAALAGVGGAVAVG